MEPLDPKAELMRLVDAYVDSAVAGSHVSASSGLGQEARFQLHSNRDALSAAITAALAAARRSALEEAMKVCDFQADYAHDVAEGAFADGIKAGAERCHHVIRALIDGKAGGT